MRGRTPRWRCVFAVVCALLAAAGIAISLTWGRVFDSVVARQVALVPGSRSFREWEAPSVPLFMDVYLFNWTNSENFPQEKPHLVQLGPYRFKEHRQHVNVTWHVNNGSMAYRTLRSWHFQPSSNGSLDDNVTMLNIIAASAIYRARDWGFLEQKMLSMSLAMFGQHMVVSKPARELLFEGYEDALLDVAKTLPASATGGAPPVDRFGLFYERNNSITTDGYMEVSTGVDSGTLPGQVLRWNYEDYLPYYTGECAKLKGSAGEFLPRDLTERSAVTVFVPDLCRSIQLTHKLSGELGGLPYHRYSVAPESFDNSTSSHHNTCFCNGDCSWGGVMNVSACRYGSPSFISLPHFLHADPALAAAVSGLQPDEDKHSFYFSVEPNLGVPLEVAARFQLNVLIEPNPNIALYEKVPKMLFPIFWVEQSVQTEASIIEELVYARTILEWGATVCACTALLLLVLVALATCCVPRHKYARPADGAIISEKPKDEAEIKLNNL
ncbi:protein peste-like isoform X2 [Cydia pomonella]|uniref:protein peste-like isoform X2 n=1 Tax=Cydia pomonella TaxID=82600 RepID=UPI002ADE3755|nr:protein peste-like isoform X2 [Cydia pomonella]